MAQRTKRLPVEALIVPERTRFFPGRLLGADDLNREQQYQIGHRRLHNLAVLGVGVVSGLKVTAKGGEVEVSPGVAIDALGREIVVPGCARAPVPPAPGRARRAVVVLRYFEEEVQPLATDGGLGEGVVQHGVIRETFRLTVERAKPTPPDAGLVLTTVSMPRVKGR